ncbi:MAG: hypothetical protein JNM31_11050 [Flavobacteriales bacterium]|nr:hypothetical protein [Flavobacteriales bacterium]
MFQLIRPGLFFPLLFFFGPNAGAQIAQGGEPMGWGEWATPAGISERALTYLDRAALLASDTLTGTGFRYGVQRSFEVDVMESATWEKLPDGRRVGRLLLRSPGAVMTSFQFSAFDPAPDAMIFFYDVDRTHLLGGFNERNKLPTGTFATAVVKGDAVIIEIQERSDIPESSVLQLSSITHGYKDIFHFFDPPEEGEEEEGDGRDYYPGYESLPCQVNINCPTASAWQQQKRAVTMFLRPDGNGCTGQLINNTLQNGRPYYYIAHHCYPTQWAPQTEQWVFYFNYESAGCVGNTGPTSQTLTGAQYRSGSYFKDFVLLELFHVPPPSYQAFYAGWDRTGNIPTSQVVISHPMYDVKKFTRDVNPPTTSFPDPDSGVECWRNYWDTGIIEAVSSGGALWDQNGRIVGHMFDGAQNCSNAATVPTDCAKFVNMWNGTSATNRLRDWLDPANTSTTLNGLDPATTPLTPIRVRARVMLEGPFDGTSLMNGTLRSSGLIPLAQPYVAPGYVHVVGGGTEVTTNGVLNVTGTNSIVDWVVVELRDKTNPALVLASRSALLQRDGDVVDVDGTSDVAFHRPADDYYIAIRHRNHLAIMTAAPVNVTATAVQRNFANGSQATYGGTAAMKLIGTVRCMFAGDVNHDGLIKYSGAANDRDPILSRIGGVTATNTVSGYFAEDINMDGVVRYSGGSNDRDIILVNIGGATPTNTRSAGLP